MEAIDGLPFTNVQRDPQPLAVFIPLSSRGPAFSGISSGGQRTRNQNYLLDGTDNNELSVTGSVLRLIPEELSELQVQYPSLSAEFGHNSGSQISLITRSGSNQFHASIWDYHRSSKFDEASETYLEIPSDGVPFDQRPWMKSAETADAILASLERGDHAFIRANFAAGDMVGHTGVLSAAIKAVETVDAGLGRIVAALRRAGGALVVTADHGNCEQMRDYDTGGPHTAHTTNPVPVVVWNSGANAIHRGRLADLAPTLLALMGVPRPKDMTGEPILG